MLMLHIWTEMRFTILLIVYPVFDSFINFQLLKTRAEDI